MPDQGKLGRLVDRRGGGKGNAGGRQDRCILCGTAVLSSIGIAVPDRRNFPHFDVNQVQASPKVKLIARASPKTASSPIRSPFPHRAADHPVGRPRGGEVRRALRWRSRIDTLAGLNLRGGRCGAE
jgi:hypothetical protein